MGKQGRQKKGSLCWPRRWLWWTKLGSVAARQSCIGSREKLTLQTVESKVKKQKAKGKIIRKSQPQSLIPDPQGEAEACFLKAIEIARKQQAKSLELRATMSLARLWQQQGKQERSSQDVGRDLRLVHRRV